MKLKRYYIVYLCWNCGKVGKVESINQPGTDDQTNEGGFGNKVDTEENDGEERSNDRHKSTESEPIQ